MLKIMSIVCIDYSLTKLSFLKNAANEENKNEANKTVRST